MILITGATDGIGLALAQHYAASNTDLIGVGRKPLSALDPTLFNEQNYCQADLAQPDCAETVHDFLQARNLHALDYVVCNAAVGYYGPTAAQSPEDITAMVAVNLAAPMALTQVLLPYLTAARGKIAFISSVVANLPCPQYAVYGATKAALEDFARNLRTELRDTPVQVQLVRPGAVNTGMHQKSGVDPTTMNTARFPAAETTARQIAHALAGRRNTVTLGGGNKLLRLVGHCFPGVMEWAAGRQIS